MQLYEVMAVTYAAVSSNRHTEAEWKWVERRMSLHKIGSGLEGSHRAFS